MSESSVTTVLAGAVLACLAIVFGADPPSDHGSIEQEDSAGEAFTAALASPPLSEAVQVGMADRSVVRDHGASDAPAKRTGASDISLLDQSKDAAVVESAPDQARVLL